MNWARMLWLGGALSICAAAAMATENSEVIDRNALDHQLQSLKEEVLALNRDLLVLQEDLLFPASRQLAVYLSMDRGTLFELESVELKLDDRVVTTHLYSSRELKALARGGSHQLWIGNVPSGEHELAAFLTGIGPNGRAYRRAAALTVAKGHAPKTVELKIADLQRKLQPEFVMREWK
jgi:hypothetical protein